MTLLNQMARCPMKTPVGGVRVLRDADIQRDFADHGLISTRSAYFRRTNQVTIHLSFLSDVAGQRL
jgi:hypothetical protein